jgi:hypothetical protein
MSDDGSQDDAPLTITDGDIDVTYVAARIRRYSRLERGAPSPIYHPPDQINHYDTVRPPVLWDTADAHCGWICSDMYKYPMS